MTEAGDLPVYKIVSAMRRLTIPRLELQAWPSGQVRVEVGDSVKALAWFRQHFPPPEGQPAHLAEHGRRPAKRASHRRPARPAAPDTWCWRSGYVTVRYHQPHVCDRFSSSGARQGERPSWYCSWCGRQPGVTEARRLGLIA